MQHLFTVIVFLHVIFALIPHVSSASVDQSSLRLVIIIHRHGDRTPIHCYPKDPYRNETNWPDGRGQLRKDGKERMYNYGRILRKHYQNFLTNNPREVSVRSSAADRCLESTTLLLAGLYPPQGRWVWESNVNWQPFPVKSVPLNVDGMLNPDSDCPNADAEKNRIRKSEGYIKYNENNREFYQYLTLNTGAQVNDIDEAERISDVILIEKQMNLTLPLWVNEEVIKKMEDVTAYSFYFDYSTKLIQKLRAGLIIKEIREKLKEAAAPKSKMSTEDVPKKILVFSSHDTLIAAILSSFNVFDIIAPPYGASVIFELHSLNDTNHQVFAYYRNETKTDRTHLLKLPVCGFRESCHIGEFLHNTEDLIVDDWREACGLPSNLKSGSSDETKYFVVIALLAATVFIAVILMFVHFKRRGKPYVYRLLPVST